MNIQRIGETLPYSSKIAPAFKKNNEKKPIIDEKSFELPTSDEALAASGVTIIKSSKHTLYPDGTSEEYITETYHDKDGNITDGTSIHKKYDKQGEELQTEESSISPYSPPDEWRDAYDLFYAINC